MVQFAAPTLPLLSVLHVREPFFLSLHFFTWTANFAGRASIFDESLVVATVAWTTLLFRRIVHSVAWVVLMVQFTVSRFLGCSACVSSSFRFVSPSHFALACSLSTCLSVSLSLSLSLLRSLSSVYRHVFWLVQEHREHGRPLCAEETTSAGCRFPWSTIRSRLLRPIPLIRNCSIERWLND